MRSLRTLVAVCVLTLFAGCAAGPREAGESRTTRGSSELITRTELGESRASNLYEHIRLNRPTWLRPRGTVTLGQETTVMVYLDRVRYGGPESLRQLTLDGAERIRFLSASLAQQEFGHDHPHGVIQVISRQGR